MVMVFRIQPMLFMKAAAARAWPLVLVFAFAFAETFPAAAKDGEVPALPLLPTRALDVTARPATREQLAQANHDVAPPAMFGSARKDVMWGKGGSVRVALGG